MGGKLKKKPIEQRVKGELVQIMVDYWEECSCLSQKRIDRLLKSSQITFEYRKKSFDNFSLDVHETIREAFRKSRIYHDRFNDIKETSENWICMMGQPGCGKTHLLMAISNGFIDKGIETFYFPYVEGFEEIKNDMKKEDINQGRFDKMKSVPVLFIDDLFKPTSKQSFPTDYEVRKMYEVLNHRYLNCLPTMISTERSIAELVDIDEALGSRINEKCKDFRILIKGENLNYRMREDEG